MVRPSTASSSKDTDESEQYSASAAGLPVDNHTTPAEDHGVTRSIPGNDQSSAAEANITATQSQPPDDPVDTTPDSEVNSAAQTPENSEVKPLPHPVSTGIAYLCKDSLNRCHEDGAVQDF
jgi:hypothetical protein